jgi:hypothetical protein
MSIKIKKFNKIVFGRDDFQKIQENRLYKKRFLIFFFFFKF